MLAIYYLAINGMHAVSYRQLTFDCKKSSFKFTSHLFNINAINNWNFTVFFFNKNLNKVYLPSADYIQRMIVTQLFAKIFSASLEVAEINVGHAAVLRPWSDKFIYAFIYTLYLLSVFPGRQRKMMKTFYYLKTS